MGGEAPEPLGGQFVGVQNGNSKIAMVTPSSMPLMYSQLENEPNRPSSLGCRGGASDLGSSSSCIYASSVLLSRYSRPIKKPLPTRFWLI